LPAPQVQHLVLARLQARLPLAEGNGAAERFGDKARALLLLLLLSQQQLLVKSSEVRCRALRRPRPCFCRRHRHGLEDASID
jgi:hypothetical protein